MHYGKQTLLFSNIPFSRNVNQQVTRLAIQVSIVTDSTAIGLHYVSVWKLFTNVTNYYRFELIHIWAYSFAWFEWIKMFLLINSEKMICTK